MVRMFVCSKKNQDLGYLKMHKSCILPSRKTLISPCCFGNFLVSASGSHAKMVDPSSLRYGLTLSAAAVRSELFQSVLAQLENLPSHGWNSISGCHDTIHCAGSFISNSIRAMCSLRFLALPNIVTKAGYLKQGKKLGIECFESCK